jgi:hypothetical protein
LAELPAKTVIKIKGIDRCFAVVFFRAYEVPKFSSFYAHVYIMGYDFL